MRRFVLKALAAAILAPWVAFAAFAPACAASELRSATVASAVMKQALDYVVYLPDGYDTTRDRYPVLYLLHGAGGDARDWTDLIHIQTIADDMIAARTIPPTLIVMPVCRACWWIDSPHAKIETAFWSDLVPEIAARYRTIETREARAIAGYSAGGYGAVRWAMKYPDRFAAVAAFSPAVYADTPPAASSARSQTPFNDETGTFSPAIWKAHNYPAQIDAYNKQPQRVPMYLVSGDHDKLGIAFETALLFKSMFEIQAESVELRVVDGGHSTEVAAKALPDALKYVFNYMQPPIHVAAEQSSKAPASIVIH